MLNDPQEQMPPTLVQDTPVQVPTPKKSMKKWFFIGGGAVVLILALVGGYFGLKLWADNTAYAYAKAIDTSLDGIFANESRSERLKLLNVRIRLDPVPLGTLVSNSYKDAHDNLVPLYNETIDQGVAATQAARDYNESINTFIADMRKALTYDLPKLGEIRDFNDVTQAEADKMERLIMNNYEVADNIDAAADTLEQATSLQHFSHYNATLAKTREWADVRRSVSDYIVVWLQDFVDWGEKTLESAKAAIAAADPSLLTDAFDSTSYKAKVDEAVAKNIAVSNQAVDELTKLVDEIIDSGLGDEVTAQLNAANAKMSELNKKLEDFVPAEVLNDT